jgi:hypothetical protein
MKRELAILLVIGIALVGMAGAANYMYEKANIKGVGYKNVETIIQTQAGLAGNKLVEKESGSGNVITERTEIEAERDPFGPECCELIRNSNGPIECYECCVDYINFTKEAEFEYMPVSYQTGTYDQKWIEKLCVQNYYIGAVVVEMYTHAEHLQKNTEVKTRRDCTKFESLMTPASAAATAPAPLRRTSTPTSSVSPTSAGSPRTSAPTARAGTMSGADPLRI